jgi:hypothetical protein
LSLEAQDAREFVERLRACLNGTVDVDLFRCDCRSHGIVRRSGWPLEDRSRGGEDRHWQGREEAPPEVP